MRKTVLFASLVIIMAGCAKSDQQDPPAVTYGKNAFTIEVDGLPREYIVQIPAGYSAGTPIPVVFMLHGTGGDGELMYEDSGWKEVGETETILTVYPSALRRCIVQDQVESSAIKWNSQPASPWKYCPSAIPPDDIKFLKAVIAELENKYTVDSKRIYFVGFSNGGQMCAKLSILMSDQIAAIVESASSFSFDSTLFPLRHLPITFQIGNDDHGPGGSGPELPLSKFALALQTPGNVTYTAAQTHIKSFDLDPDFTISGDTNTLVVATYLPNNGDTTNNFNLALINGLKHAYPNGTNHWLHAAEIDWSWMKKYALP